MAGSSNTYAWVPLMLYCSISGSPFASVGPYTSFAVIGEEPPRILGRAWDWEALG